MGSFIEDLWSSIFTPGPTPTLLVATNVTFAALQTLLFALLLGTYSIHFVVLSILSASLWGSINWFARELQQVQAAEGEKNQAEEIPTEEKPVGNRKTPGALDSTESDTETESLTDHKSAAAASRPASSRSTPAPATPAPSAALQLPGNTGEVRKRLSVSGDSSGYGSTDSEWEKVDDTK